MKTSNKGIELLKRFEGLSLKPYKDAIGVATIGYGCTCYKDGTAVKITDIPISNEQAEALLRETLVQYESGVLELVRVPLNQNQFDALVCFAYNVGIGNLKKSTLLKRLNDGCYTDAAEQFLRWNRAGGRVLNGLAKRRKLEKELFLS